MAMLNGLFSLVLLCYILFSDVASTSKYSNSSPINIEIIIMEQDNDSWEEIEKE
jgi:hypothetical protein